MVKGKSGFDGKVARNDGVSLDDIVIPGPTKSDCVTDIADRQPANGDHTPKRETPRINGFDLNSPSDFETRSDPGFNPAGNDFGSTTSEPRKRGRPFGSKNKEKIVSSNLIPDLESLLLSIHFMVSRVTGYSELELSDHEARDIAEAVKNVAQYYPLGLDPKKLAIGQLCFTLAGVYGPKATAIYRKSNEKKGPVLVSPIPPKTPSHEPIMRQGVESVGTRSTKLDPIIGVTMAHTASGTDDDQNFAI
jgi:hypothetical protein